MLLFKPIIHNLDALMDIFGTVAKGRFRTDQPEMEHLASYAKCDGAARRRIGSSVLLDLYVLFDFSSSIFDTTQVQLSGEDYFVQALSCACRRQDLGLNAELTN